MRKKCVYTEPITVLSPVKLAYTVITPLTSGAFRLHKHFSVSIINWMALKEFLCFNCFNSLLSLSPSRAIKLRTVHSTQYPCRTKTTTKTISKQQFAERFLPKTHFTYFPGMKSCWNIYSIYFFFCFSMGLNLLFSTNV